MPDDATERWLPVVGWEGLYEVSDRGRVRSVKTGAILNPLVPRHGRYWTVNLRRERNVWPVHTLVAAAFLGVRPDGEEVDHVNGDRLDNTLANLEYVPPPLNKQRAHERGLMRQHPGSANGAAKLTEGQVAEIMMLAAVGGARPVKQRELALRYGVSQSTISSILRGKSWQSVDAPPRPRRPKGTPGAVGSRHPMSRLTEVDVIHMCAEYATGEWTQAQLAARYGVSRAAVGLALQGRTWGHVSATRERRHVLGAVDAPRSLRWSSGNGNPAQKLTEAGALDILRRYAAGETQPALARAYGVTQTCVSFLVRGKTWRHLPRPPQKPT
jgi:DNA-binding XRE family transcriptional regulator